MRKSKRGANKIGLYFAAFGFGLIVSSIFPASFVVGVLAVAIIVLGLAVGR